jgi:ribosomal protein S5
LLRCARRRQDEPVTSAGLGKASPEAIRKGIDKTEEVLMKVPLSANTIPFDWGVTARAR